MTVSGKVTKRFEAVREAFAKAQATDEGGAQLCVYHRGEMVVDLWCGRDKEHNRPFDGDTITLLMSCTKGMVATCAQILIERGLLDPDAPVSEYWPEFAAQGKSEMPVSYVLSHQAGLPVLCRKAGGVARATVGHTEPCRHRPKREDREVDAGRRIRSRGSQSLLN
jgi:CubicO group peptidase (beta-lactamase class C family)